MENKNCVHCLKQIPLDEEGFCLYNFYNGATAKYDFLFIPDANDGVTPHSKAVLDDDFEDVRRMFYVAMTRARKYLYICYVKERFNKDAEISGFVREILSERKS